MKITKIWEGFESDHSSTNYNFYSSTKELSEKEIIFVNSYSSRADSSDRFVEFTYYGDFADLPDDAQEKLLYNIFDIMVKESYDWWELILTLPYNTELFNKLEVYDCSNDDDLGISITKNEEQIVLSIFCVIDYKNIHLLAFDAQLHNKDFWSPNIYHHDRSPFAILANLLIRLKIEILNGGFHTLQCISAFFDPENFVKPDISTDLCKSLIDALGRL